MSSAPDIWSAFRAGLPRRDAAWRAACLEALRRSGLFDAAFHASQTGQTCGEAEALAAYHDRGWRDGQRPNIAFDPGFYRATYPDVAAGDGDPLLHYVSYGEAEGRRPVAWFDPAWYRVRYAVPASQHALAHYLLHRKTGCVSPIPEFDAAWYLARSPDVAAAAMDPMEHYLVQGFREGRDPSPDFDTRFYRMRYLRGLGEENPLLHYLAHRNEPGVHARQPNDEPTIADEVRRLTGPGPDFELPQALPANAPRRALVLAFYLPQFHRVTENDAWWGTGFTEWTNVARASPRFVGHYQPRIPRDLGYYDLDDPRILARQVALARGAGIGGFVQYFYWFDGKRLLERPIERMLADRSVDFPFCLMWANENWTRRWDGAEQEVLLRQTYRRADEPALMACFARHFADPRYLRLDGRPLLFIYRASLIPRARATIARWRAIFREAHGEDPILVMAQSFTDRDPRRFGFDAAVEFPPHKLTDRVSLINDRLDLLDAKFTGKVYDYTDVATAAAMAPAVDFPLIRCAVPGWDNDARRPGAGVVVHGATPGAYGQWLDALITGAIRAPVFGTPIVCINAWNEWAEAAYLEPDVHCGAAFLNATARAVAGVGANSSNRLLIVGHDAFAAGAQLLLLAVARMLCRRHGLVLQIVLGGGGDLLAGYRACGRVSVVETAADRAALFAALRARGFDHALVNSAASAAVCADLAGAGIAHVLLVHEMRGLIAREALAPPLAAAVVNATATVFACETVRRSVGEIVPIEDGRARILPQPVYQDLRAGPGARARLRDALGVLAGDMLVVAVGHGDARKGFDLFLALAGLAAAADRHFAWAGDISPALRATCATAIDAAIATGRVHLLGFRPDIGAVLRAADMLVLPSREDPYPSAVLEARAMGLPVIAFAGSGGVGEMARAGGITLVAMEDVGAMAASLRQAGPIGRRPKLPGEAFGSYVATLLALARPDLAPVSVVVPCYNQAPYLAPRLASIFAQTLPVRQIVLRDDASSDGGAATARRLARRARRDIAVVRAPVNSGSPFVGWREAVAQASGELVWIAEADDVAAPDFLAALAPLFADPAMLLAFADSRAIGPDGTARPEDYRASYEAAAGPGALASDAVYEADAFARSFLAERNLLFNVSAVVWRRAALHAVLDRLGAELAGWRVAGDWRVYIELLTQGAGRVGHVARLLNAHRRSADSASAAVPGGPHRAEIARMHRLIRTRLGDPPGLRQRQARYRAMLRRIMG